MAARNNKSKSSGMRILWIPGGRKGHPKGRFDSTNKQISYSPKQKKSEVWSLGGSKAQKDFLKAEPDTALLDGPTSSGLTPVACALGAVGASTECPAATENAEELKNPTICILSPTPSSTASTAALTSSPNSPSESNTPSFTMPAKTTPTAAVTTTAEIIDDNRFSILSKDISDDFDIDDLPHVPKDDLNKRDNLILNSSAETTVSTAATTSSNKSETNKDVQSRKKLHHRNHNNNHQQGDINSIESISDNNLNPLNTDFPYLEQNGNEVLQKTKRKKKKKLSTAKEMDQLDGVPNKLNTSDPPIEEEDEKVVKCLYYTLMCCDCTIS